MEMRFLEGYKFKFTGGAISGHLLLTQGGGGGKKLGDAYFQDRIFRGT